MVFGFFGLMVLTTWIRVTFDVPTGETWPAGSLLLALMALPTIISVSEDAISSAPREYKEGLAGARGHPLADHQQSADTGGPLWVSPRPSFSVSGGLPGRPWPC